MQKSAGGRQQMQKYKPIYLKKYDYTKYYGVKGKQNSGSI